MPKVRSVCEGAQGQLIVGTRASEIIQFKKSGDSYDKGTLLNIGHYDFELWGLAMIPGSDDYITCGEDFMLAKWDISAKK